METKVSDSFLV